VKTLKNLASPWHPFVTTANCRTSFLQKKCTVYTAHTYMRCV